MLGLPLWLSWWRIHPQCGRPGFDPWVGKVPWRRERLPTPVFWPGEFHGLYSPWGPKESDMTERLSLHSVMSAGLRLDAPSSAFPAATWCCFPVMGGRSLCGLLSNPRFVKLESCSVIYYWEDLPSAILGAREAVCEILLVEANWNLCMFSLWLCVVTCFHMVLFVWLFLLLLYTKLKNNPSCLI